MSAAGVFSPAFPNTRPFRPFAGLLGVPPNLPGSVEPHFDASRIRSTGSNSQKFRKGGLEIREFIAGEVFIRPTRVIVAAIASFLVLAPQSWQNWDSVAGEVCSDSPRE
jgi:hypothetical protein